MRQFVPLYIAIGIVALLLVAALQWWASKQLAGYDMVISPWIAAGTGIAAVIVIGLVYIVNRINIRKNINAIS
ncbi:hypothetical protein [Chitinophaga pinensis]|uniref:Uncharacterized protein n=1 Tax=Chitinophaga pinensis TaxID=79329 RepID=A0A5C6M0J5_9BACT|nr:hypothetical protein [Chitinophaga pinensis]TWW02448.1 hypothetical protein FEF09_01175 [Chitinophaga pinensis]